MIATLPTSVNIDGKEYKIREKCDYRVVLDCISALNDGELTEIERLQCALYIFYEDAFEIENITEAINQMYNIIRGGEPEPKNVANKPRLMDWEHDFSKIAPAVNKVLGYEVRDADKFVHWYTFLGAFGEIGDCTFAQIVSIRSKRLKGQKLDKFELEYFRDHREQIELPKRFSAEELAALNEQW